MSAFLGKYRTWELLEVKSIGKRSPSPSVKLLPWNWGAQTLGHLGAAMSALTGLR